MSFIREEAGVGAVEYGLFAGFWTGLILTVYLASFISLTTCVNTINSVL
jgi:Flp pilus assembly pilin Flp